MSKNMNMVQTSMVSGILSDDSIGRIDIQKYHNGVSRAENMIVEPLGGMKKRSGYEYLAPLGGHYRMIEFLFNTDDKYLILVGDGDMLVWDIMNPGDATFIPVEKTVDAVWYTGNQKQELDFVQSADTVVFTHQNTRPQKLVRDRSVTPIVWRLEVVTLTNIPQYNWDDGSFDSGASRVKKAADEADEGTILKIRDDIINAISLGEAVQPRVVSLKEEVSSIILDVDTITTTTTTERNTWSATSPHAYDVNGNWGTKQIIDEQHTLTADDVLTTNVIWDETLEEIINEALRNRISLKDTDYNLLNATQITALMGTSFSDVEADIKAALDAVLGSFEPDTTNIVDVWGDTAVNGNERGWPKYCAFYQNRLMFAGSTAKPLSIWGSVINDFFNFDISESDADFAIADTLNTDTLNHITGLYPSKTLQVYTSGAEYVNTSNPMTPTDSNWVFQTGLGSSANVALDSLDGSTFFIDRSGGIREFIYNFDMDNYVAKNLALLASQVVKRPKQVVIIRSSQIDLGKLIYFLNDDGTLAVLNIDNNEKILAWTEWKTDGNIVEIEGVDQSLFVVVEREGVYTLEVLGSKELSANAVYNPDNDVFLDSYSLHLGTTFNEVCADSIGGGYATDYLLDGILSNDCSIFYSGVAEATVIDGLDRFNGKYVTVLLDDFYHGEELVVNGEITVERAFFVAKVGLMYNSLIKTLPITSKDQSTQLNYNRIVKIVVQFYNSAAVTIDGEEITDRRFDEYQLGSKPELFSGVKEVYQLGWDKLRQFEISSDYPYNFHILSFTSVLDSNSIV